MSKFFINRPIFASVISIVIVLAGLVAAMVLPWLVAIGWISHGAFFRQSSGHGATNAFIARTGDQCHLAGETGRTRRKHPPAFSR